MCWRTGHMQNPKDRLLTCILSTVFREGKRNESQMKYKGWNWPTKEFSPLSELGGFLLSWTRDQEFLKTGAGWFSTWRCWMVRVQHGWGGSSKARFIPLFLPLTENITGLAKTNLVPLGSFMPIWAAVEQKSHQPLLLLMDECVAASTAELQPDSEVYTIIGNKG